MKLVILVTRLIVEQIMVIAPWCPGKVPTTAPVKTDLSLWDVREPSFLQQLLRRGSIYDFIHRKKPMIVIKKTDDWLKNQWLWPLKRKVLEM